MECTLAALIACFSWSNLYVDGGVLYQDAGMYHEVIVDNSATVVVDGKVSSTSRHQVWQYDRPANPYGRLSLGHEWRFAHVSWRLYASHVSSLASGDDRGINSIGISAQWHPFGRSR